MSSKLTAFKGLASLIVVGMLSLSSLSYTTAAATPSSDPIYGEAAATDLAALPLLDSTTLGAGVSSTDPNPNDALHGNKDYDNFISSGPAGNVMMDQLGPGCVYRLWMTSARTNFSSDWIKVYFNGDSNPAINMTVGALFSGQHAPFVTPLVANSFSSSGGYVSYVPLCYQSSIKIVTNMVGYYNIGYKTYQPGTAIKTWTPNINMTDMKTEWQNLGTDPINPAGNQSVSGTAGIAAGRNTTLASINGSDSIQAIKLTVPGVTPSAHTAAAAKLNNLWIQITWDNRSAPAVNAPIGAFFGLGKFGAFPTKNLITGLTASGQLYMYLPMPFQTHATIKLLNRGNRAIKNIGYEVQYRPFTGNFGQTGYFTTTYTVTNNAADGRDIPILNVAGSGKLVGVQASYTGPTNRSYLEGDERIYVDGLASPAFEGTGTEDFFNGGFYFERGTYSNAMSGESAHLVAGGHDETAAYRFMVSDAVPFQNHLTASIQHGPNDNVADSASMLAFYYLKPATTAVLTDTLNVGNSASESSHHYKITNQTWSGSHTYEYAGTRDHTKITDNGRADKGSSQFVLAVNPTNAGVILRRRYDQGVASQRAVVYVNGRLVGSWLVAGKNLYTRWADADFVIPASYTAGQSHITVQVKFVSSQTDWNEFTYWAYSLRP